MPLENRQRRDGLPGALAAPPVTVSEAGQPHTRPRTNAAYGLTASFAGGSLS